MPWKKGKGTAPLEPATAQRDSAKKRISASAV